MFDNNWPSSTVPRPASPCAGIENADPLSCGVTYQELVTIKSSSEFLRLIRRAQTAEVERAKRNQSTFYTHTETLDRKKFQSCPGHNATVLVAASRESEQTGTFREKLRSMHKEVTETQLVVGSFN